LGAAIAGVLGLTGCGGGGSSPNDAGDSSFTSATTAGTAAKGIISGGIVTAVELSSDQSVLRDLATTTTDATGAYQLTIPASYAGGPIKITVSTGADTQMKCDVTTGCGTRADNIEDTDTNVDFGEWYKPGEGKVTMDALLASAVSGATVAANITPFTHMAAARAMASTNLDADAVANANSEVSVLLGTDIHFTKPVDITDPDVAASPSEIAYAALSAAIANLATKDETTGVPDIAAAIDNLTQSFADGVIKASDDGSDSAVVSLNDIVTAASSTLTSAGVADTSGTLSSLQAKVDSAGETGVIDPEPADTATLSSVEKAKAFVADFRTYINDMDAAINNPNFGGEFKNQVGLASDTVTVLNGPENPVAVLDLAHNIAFNTGFYNFDTESSESSSYTFTEEDGYPFTSGTAAYDAGKGTFTFTNAKVGSQTVNLTITMIDDENCSFTESADYSSYSGSCNGTYTSGVSGSIVSPLTSLTITEGEVNVYDYEYSNSSTNTGDTYFYTYEDMGTDSFDYDMNVQYVFKETAEATPVTFSGNMQSLVLSKYAYTGSGSYDSTTGSSTDNWQENDTTFVKNMALNGSVVYGNESVRINATASQPNADTFFNTETVETSDNWLQMSAGLGLTVDINDLSGVAVTLSASRTAFDKAVAELKLQHNQRSLVVAFETPIVQNEPTAVQDSSFAQYMGLTLGEPTASVTVTNLDGAKMVFVPNFASVESGPLANVTLNGVKVATISLTDDGLVKTSYSDGTFEIF
jgi:hypothetical protein